MRPWRKRVLEDLRLAFEEQRKLIRALEERLLVLSAERERDLFRVSILEGKVEELLRRSMTGRARRAKGRAA
jgi:hypothetical protein